MYCELTNVLRMEGEGTYERKRLSHPGALRRRVQVHRGAVLLLDDKQAALRLVRALDRDRVAEAGDEVAERRSRATRNRSKLSEVDRLHGSCPFSCVWFVVSVSRDVRMLVQTAGQSVWR